MVGDLVKKEFDLMTLFSDITEPLENFLIGLYRATAPYRAVAGKTDMDILEELKENFPGDITVCDIVLAMEENCKTKAAKIEGMRYEALFKNRVDLLYKQVGLKESYPFKACANALQKDPEKESEYTLAI